LKEYKLTPSPARAEILRARFDRIFKRAKTQYRSLKMRHTVSARVNRLG
jgi:hypothetical protein